MVVVIIAASNSPAVQAPNPKTKKVKFPEGTFKDEIMCSLSEWNQAAKDKDLEKFMALFDNTPEIMLVSSDSGEVFKGKKKIEKWLRTLFGFASFYWEMNRIDIDHFENTAWVFVEGFMVVDNDRGSSGKTPYRFTGVMVKKNGAWKWRLFNGSVPEGE
jgi:ketosteroid isomerase-like protein